MHSMVNLLSISFRRRLFLIYAAAVSNLSIKLSNKPTNYGTVNLNEFWNCYCVWASATLPLKWRTSPADNVSNALQLPRNFAIPETCTARSCMLLKSSRDQNKPPVQDSQSSCRPRLTTVLPGEYSADLVKTGGSTQRVGYLSYSSELHVSALPSSVCLVPLFFV